VSVREECLEEVKQLFHSNKLTDFTTVCGKMIGKNDKTVFVK
jgi:hypothetical protein